MQSGDRGGKVAGKVLSYTEGSPEARGMEELLPCGCFAQRQKSMQQSG